MAALIRRTKRRGPQRSLFGRIDSIAGFPASASGITAKLRTLRQLLAMRGQDSDHAD